MGQAYFAAIGCRVAAISASSGLQSSLQGKPTVRLLPRPRRLATMDGLKVESLATRNERDGLVHLYVGTDDEGYGGIVRPLP